MKLALITALPIALVTFAVGCSKPSPEEQKKADDALAAALASAMAMPSAAPTVNSAPAAAAANPGGIGATCNNATDGKCTESLGAEGLGAEDSCKRLGGTYKKGATPCPHDNLLGSCARTDTSSNLNDVDYYYRQPGATADTMKSLCEGVMSGKWTDAPKAGPAAAAPAAKGAAPKGKK